MNRLTADQEVRLRCIQMATEFAKQQKLKEAEILPAAERWARWILYADERDEQ